MAIKKIQKTGVGFLLDASAKTYESLEKQLREFVSNSLDAGATRINIDVLPRTRSLIITDNGEGMTEEEFDNQYLVIGCSQKYGDPSMIGRIGVGKFSAIPLSDSLTIRTKKASNDKVFQARLQLNLLKNPNNRTKNVADLELGEGEYVSQNVDDPDEEFSPNSSFTKIILEDVPLSVIEEFTNKDRFSLLKFNLGAILPLEYSENSSAMKALKRQDIELYDLFMEYGRARKVQVLIKTPKYPQGEILYRSLFGDDPEETNQKIAGELFLLKSPETLFPIRLIGFLADMTSGKKEYAPWKGLNVRVQNTTVIEHCFFNHNDAAADPRVTGELHIVGANEEELITMNRAGFVTAYEQYNSIANWVSENLDDFSRSYIRRRTDFNGKLDKKFKELKNQKQVAEAIESSVREGFNDVTINMNGLARNVLTKENEIDEIDRIKDEFGKDICEVIPIPDAAHDEIISTIVGDSHSVMVPEQLVDYRVDIQGTEYTLKYANHVDEEPVIDVDLENHVIRVNKNAPVIRNGKYSIVLAYILIELAFIASGNNLEELKKRINNILKLAFA